MACFCRKLIPSPPEAGPEAEPAAHPVVEAVADWLAARWLPSAPWQPDPEWLAIDWPEPTMPPASLSVLLSLLIAARRCEEVLAIDLAEPRAVDRLGRLVATVNGRTAELAALAEDPRPWESLMRLDSQVATVRDAVAAGSFAEDRREIAQARRRALVEPNGPWRQLLGKVKALAPLVAMGRMLQLDWGAPDTPRLLSARVRQLARVQLPPLKDPAVVTRALGVQDAVARLKRSLGSDPRAYPFERVRDAVRRRAEEVARTLPSGVRMAEGQLLGMPEVAPNPSMILNPATVKAARQLNVRVLSQMNWQVPAVDRMSLLTSLQPVAALVEGMAQLGPSPVRQSPCAPDCDAARLGRAQAATAPPGSGTGAAPAG